MARLSPSGIASGMTGVSELFTQARHWGVLFSMDITSSSVLVLQQCLSKEAKGKVSSCWRFSSSIFKSRLNVYLWFPIGFHSTWSSMTILRSEDFPFEGVESCIDQIPDQEATEISTRISLLLRNPVIPLHDSQDANLQTPGNRV